MVELPEPPTGSVVAAGRTVFLREEDDEHGAAWRKIGHLTTYGWADVLEVGDVRVIRHGLADLSDDATEAECEREDCQRIAAAASDVYCQITGGLLSYPTYDARTIIAHADEQTQKLVDEECARVRAEAVADERRLTIDVHRRHATLMARCVLVESQGGDTIPVATVIADLMAAGSVPVATPPPEARLRNALAEAGAVIEAMPHDWRFRRVDEAREFDLGGYFSERAHTERAEQMLDDLAAELRAARAREQELQHRIDKALTWCHKANPWPDLNGDLFRGLIAALTGTEPNTAPLD